MQSIEKRTDFQINNEYKGFVVQISIREYKTELGSYAYNKGYYAHIDLSGVIPTLPEL